MQNYGNKNLDYVHMAQLVNRKRGNSVRFPDTKHFAARPADSSQAGLPVIWEVRLLIHVA